MTLAEIDREHRDKVLQRCMSVLGNREDAEDCTQTVLLKAYGKQHLRTQDAGFGAWMFRLAHCTALDYYRMRHRRQKRSATLGFVIEDADGYQTDACKIFDPGPSPGEIAEMAETVAEIVRASGPYRNLIPFLIDGCSDQEMADGLGISVRASRSRLHRLRNRVRASLDGMISA